MRGLGLLCASWLLYAMLGLPAVAATAPVAEPPPAEVRVEAALQNIVALQRPGQDGYATFWDGNKYVQCGRAPRGGYHCEAAGALLQPSLQGVLTPERVKRLADLGWRLDPHFGNYVQTFPPSATAGQVTLAVLLALEAGYDVNLYGLEVETDWLPSQPCPPRNGFSQNLAGMINDAPSMAATAIRACAYAPPPPPAASAGSAELLVELYGPRATAEIGRLRVNLERNVFVVFDAGIGYVQCEPQTAPDVIYCEAQSPQSWAALTSVLTPERLAKLRAAGYADPGRAANYWKNYPLDKYDDAAIAREVIILLHDVYGYTGAEQLSIKTEAGREP
ncbi:MAG TPA: hypothetical protein VN694_00030 [Caulobacteraceae bacterium]|nr:hypothetical protein [Caulobacteraceae bacterium]